jgi:hypothetical protein
VLLVGSYWTCLASGKVMLVQMKRVLFLFRQV